MGRPAYWTEPRVRELAANYDYASDFMRSHESAYAAAKRMKLTKELFPVNKRLIWTEERLHKEAAKYETKREFRLAELGAYSRACGLGILDDICGHMKTARLKEGRLDLAKHIGISGIYYLFSGRELIYIGKSESCVVGRIRDHYKDKDFDSLEIYPMLNIADMLIAEAYLIATNRPKFNDLFVTDFMPTIQVSNISDVIGEPIIITSFGVNGMNSYKGRP